MPETLHHLYLNWFKHFTLELAARGADMVGVDRAAALLRRARPKASTHPTQLTWIQGNLASLPLASQSFEGALSPSWPWILSRPAPPVLRELGRVVRPRGFLGAAARKQTA